MNQMHCTSKFNVIAADTNSTQYLLICLRSTVLFTSTGMDTFPEKGEVQYTVSWQLSTLERLFE